MSPILTAGGVPLTTQEQDAMYAEFKRRMGNDWIRAKRLSVLGDIDANRELIRQLGPFSGGSAYPGQYRGTTAGAAPSVGTAVLGDYAWDTYFLGEWRCTTAGASPTWTLVSGAAIYARMHNNASTNTWTPGDNVVGMDAVTWDELKTASGNAMTLAVSGGQSGANSAHFVAPVKGNYIMSGAAEANGSASVMSQCYGVIYSNPTFSSNLMSNNRGNAGEPGWRAEDVFYGSATGTNNNIVVAVTLEMQLNAGDKVYLGIGQAAASIGSSARVDLEWFNIRFAGAKI